MKHIHRSNERGSAEHGWLHTKFSFSFSEYYNPKRMGFGALRVLNDDIIDAGNGFGMHPHKNMEIITIPLKGDLTHEDSLGTKEVIGPGDIQVMSAGKGIVHSEFNHSDASVELLQIWIEPKIMNVSPRHDMRKIELKENELNVIVSGDEQSEGAFIYQDAKLLLGAFEAGKEFSYKVEEGNGVFIFLIEGSANAAGEELNKRDSLETDEHVQFKAIENCYVLVIEVPLE